ncbi:MAG: (d)CMP kinase [Planctomycetales bacterium]|nr:(d)CMP kinase [Planctomycetales bacterium]
MIVTIDGPAGAGKSSVARALAGRLGFRFLDTGATYRAVALAAVRRGLDWEDQDALARLAREVAITVDDTQVTLDGDDVTNEIRSYAITAVTHYAATNPEVRAHLVTLQRRFADDDNVVTEGRDQGTVVFPQAGCKIFLTASAEERARRRWQDLAAQGERLSFDDVLSGQRQRDERDWNRDVGPLKKAPDAVELSTDGLTAEQVVDRLEEIVRCRMTAEA